MKRRLIELLVCPDCLPHEKRLDCSILKEDGKDILEGTLRCDRCKKDYPIQDGIASLLPSTFQNTKEGQSKYESPSLVSSYLWSHYGDLLEDGDATNAYIEWAEQLKYKPGISLDAGCAVGRFTFEMSNKSDFSIGIDSSHLFIRTARELMTNRYMEFTIPSEGQLSESLSLYLPDSWQSEKVEFIVGDALALPFRSDTFSSLASLNLIDKVPLPIKHLREMDRVANEKDSQFLFSDPFSWSTAIAKEKNWLGGTGDGPYAGKGMDNLLSLLEGKNNGIPIPWQIEGQGQIWWKIRNHRNHFELIRSCFIKARR